MLSWPVPFATILVTQELVYDYGGLWLFGNLLRIVDGNDDDDDDDDDNDVDHDNDDVDGDGRRRRRRKKKKKTAS